MSRQHDDRDPLIGLRLLDQYLVKQRLGAGGMGAVYLAHQDGLDRDVAIKFLLPQVGANADARARFFREAQATSRLVHPNVVQIYNFGDAGDGRLYLAMELVSGPSLKQHLRAARLTPTQACDLAIQIADALAIAHGLNIIHRDLKPDNVLLQPVGDRLLPKVVDFGIAKLLQTAAPAGSAAPGEAPPHEAPPHEAPPGEAPSPAELSSGNAAVGVTRAGQIFGTPEYMAPEQVTGEAIDARADIFALGVMLYEMLAGRRPIDAPTPSAHLLALFSCEPEPLPTGARSPIPRALGKLVMSMLRREAARRPASMREVRDRLARIKARLDGAGRRSPAAVAIAAGVLATLGIAVGSYVAITDFEYDRSAAEGAAASHAANAPSDATYEIAQRSHTTPPAWTANLSNDTNDPARWVFRGVARGQTSLEAGLTALRHDLAEDVLLEMAAHVGSANFARAVYLPIMTAKKTLVDNLTAATQRGDRLQIDAIAASIRANEARIGAMFEQRFPGALHPAQIYWEKWTAAGTPAAAAPVLALSSGDTTTEDQGTRAHVDVDVDIDIDIDAGVDAGVDADVDVSVDASTAPSFYYDVYGVFEVAVASLNLAYYQAAVIDDALGVVATHFFPALRWQHDVDNGAVVLDVLPDSPAAAADLRIGDVLVATDDTPIDGLSAFQQQAAARRQALMSTAGLGVDLSRGGTRRTVTLRNRSQRGRGNKP